MEHSMRHKIIGWKSFFLAFITLLGGCATTVVSNEDAKMFQKNV
jgi:hypothetical protein